MMIGLFAFYPSLGYNLLRNFIQPNIWTWYSRIDENIIIGALPFKSIHEELKGENIGGVVCCVEDFEMKAAYNVLRREDWEEKGIKFHHVPMRDFVGSTTRFEMEKVVDFITDIAIEGKTCYVHCKAGRTRSATVVACYLMQKNNYMPNVALEYLKQKRPQIVLRNAHWRTLNEFRRTLDAKQIGNNHL